MSTLRHILAILLLPVMATLIIPGAIIYFASPGNIDSAVWSPLRFVPSLLGVFLIGLGLTLMVKANVLFARVGKGTLAPWDPTQKLVVHGVYRYVRNPMISGVFCILLGEAMVLVSIPLFCWFLFVWVGNLVYTPLVEERSLERRFGEEYLEYKRHVPRWVPRLRPWEVRLGEGGKSRGLGVAAEPLAAGS